MHYWFRHRSTKNKITWNSDANIIQDSNTPPRGITRDTDCIIQGSNISLASARKQRFVDTSGFVPSKIVLFPFDAHARVRQKARRTGQAKSTIIQLIPQIEPSRCPPWVLEYFHQQGQHALAFSSSLRRLPYLKEFVGKKCKFNTPLVKIRVAHSYTRDGLRHAGSLSLFST